MKTEKQADAKALKLAKKYYPKDSKDWSQRHRMLAMLGELIYFIYK